MDGYDACQRYKNQSEAPAGKLMPNAIPEKPWSHISADFITKLPLAQGYDTILVVCDCFSKMAHFIATTEKTSAEGLAKLFRDHVWKLHGLPESIISDRGVQFVVEMMKELNNLLGIQIKLSTAYHPQTDGQTERINQELEQYLRVFIDHRQEQWLDWLGMVEFAYNNKIHAATKTLPFKANYGQDLRMGFEGRRKGKYKAAGKFALLASLFFSLSSAISSPLYLAVLSPLLYISLPPFAFCLQISSFPPVLSLALLLLPPGFSLFFPQIFLLLHTSPFFFPQIPFLDLNHSLL